ncbi:uncharacterized protein LOC144152531 [Haemaphysalis longicornis]
MKCAGSTAQGHPTICSLMVDEMSIRQQVQWNRGSFEGFVDIGTGVDSDCLPQVKAAFVIMAVAINATSILSSVCPTKRCQRSAYELVSFIVSAGWSGSWSIFQLLKGDQQFRLSCRILGALEEQVRQGLDRCAAVAAGRAVGQPQAALSFRRPHRPHAEAQDCRTLLSGQPCSPHRWWGLSSSQPWVRVLCPHVPLYRQAGVLRRCLGIRGRGRQLVGLGGQLVRPLVALEPDVAGYPLQPQPRTRACQPLRLLAQCGSPSWMRTRATRESHSRAQRSGAGASSSSRPRPSWTPTSSAVAEDAA